MGEATASGRWSAERAWQWWREQAWPVGCNFTPSTAVNQLEFWQAETFDPVTIDRELGWAAGAGLNSVRVYLHDLAWEVDPDGFLSRVDAFLATSHRHGIRPLVVIFDDCWHEDVAAGPQPDPVPGVHNSRWVQSPGRRVVEDPASWGRLERYVSAVVGAFGQDDRVLMWDVYNEPANNALPVMSLPPARRRLALATRWATYPRQRARTLRLVRAAFAWARAESPAQPLTAGVWNRDPVLNRVLPQLSDVVTFHDYEDVAHLEEQIADLRRWGRPLVCTEWMARPAGSTIATHLPVFRREDVGCVFWGLVDGRTQTKYGWTDQAGGPEPHPWFHDLLRGDGTPYDPEEVALLRSLTDQAARARRPA